jgi:hypothetical protein
MHITPYVAIFTTFTIFLISNTILYIQQLFYSYLSKPFCNPQIENKLILKQYINILSISNYFFL